MLSPVFFHGGVTANAGIKAAIEKALDMPVIVPSHYGVMGAIGAAILAKSAVRTRGISNFRGLSICDLQYSASSFECNDCPNCCEIVHISSEGRILARSGSRCGKWDNLDTENPEEKILNACP